MPNNQVYVAELNRWDSSSAPPVPGPSQQKRPRRAVRPPEPCARTVTAGFMGSDDSPSDLDASAKLREEFSFLITYATRLLLF